MKRLSAILAIRVAELADLISHLTGHPEKKAAGRTGEVFHGVVLVNRLNHRISHPEKKEAVRKGEDFHAVGLTGRLNHLKGRPLKAHPDKSGDPIRVPGQTVPDLRKILAKKEGSHFPPVPAKSRKGRREARRGLLEKLPPVFHRPVANEAVRVRVGRSGRVRQKTGSVRRHRSRQRNSGAGEIPFRITMRKNWRQWPEVRAVNRLVAKCGKKERRKINPAQTNSRFG